MTSPACACGRGPRRSGQRTCRQCHAAYMVGFRRRQREELQRLRTYEASTTHRTTNQRSVDASDPLREPDGRRGLS
jgi:hypothetical protein